MITFEEIKKAEAIIDEVRRIALDLLEFKQSIDPKGLVSKKRDIRYFDVSPDIEISERIIGLHFNKDPEGDFEDHHENFLYDDIINPEKYKKSSLLKSKKQRENLKKKS